MNNQLSSEARSTAVTDYLNGMGKSSKAMESALRRAAAFWEGIPVAEVMPADIYLISDHWRGYDPKEFISDINKLKGALLHHYERNTAALTMAALRGVIKTAWLRGEIPDSIYRRTKEMDGLKIKAKKTDHSIGRYIEDWEIEKLKDVITQDETARGKRDLAILAWMLTQGARVSEVAQADLRDYNRRSGRLIIPSGKGDKARANELHNGAKAAMDAWIQERGSWPGALFCGIDNKGDIVKEKALHRKDPETGEWKQLQDQAGNPLKSSHLSDHAIRKMLRKRQQEAGIDPFSPHDLRRTFITNSIQKNGIRQTQIIAGHASPATTAGYDRSKLETALEAGAAIEF